MGDAGEIIMGRFGRELLGIGQLLFLIFVMASHVLTFTVLMNTITEHGTCTIVFGVIALIVSCVGALPRTMDKVYWMSIACKHIIGLLIFHTSSLIMGLIFHFCVAFLSIVAATMATMIAVGVEYKGHIPLAVTTHLGFNEEFLAVSNLFFAYGKALTCHTLFNLTNLTTINSGSCVVLWIHLRDGQATRVYQVHISAPSN
jgi:hypothetical protein